MNDHPPAELSLVLIALMKGVVEREAAGLIWQSLSTHQTRVRDYIAVLGLELVFDDTEGHAYLRQTARTEGEPELPRLIVRRQLSYPVSLLLALLRKKLAEFDAVGADVRLVITSNEILDMVRLFLPDSTNQAKLQDRVSRDIGKVVELGFLRPLKGQAETFEVRRILRSYVDAQWLGQLSERLETYAAHGRVDGGGEADL